MAKETLATKGIPLKPAGMDDNAPVQAEADWFTTRGVRSISERCLERIEGKELLNYFDSPVLGIHGDLKGFVWVETASTLYLFNALGDPLPIPPDPDPPPTIPGLLLWLKPETFSLANNDPVSLWTDSSETENDAVQATVANQPTFKTNIKNGFPAVRFDGVNDFLTFPNVAIGKTVFIVASLNVSPGSLTAYAVMFLTPNLWLSARLGGTGWGTFRTSLGELSAGENLVSGEFNILCLTSSIGTNFTNLYRNGVLKNTGTDICAGSVLNYIGSDPLAPRPTSMDVLEVLMYDTELSVPDQTILNSYLTTKFAL